VALFDGQSLGSYGTSAFSSTVKPLKLACIDQEYKMRIANGKLIEIRPVLIYENNL
jgi:hypothetical protein